MSLVAAGVGLRPASFPLQDILQWSNARTFLYWRLRRLLLEEGVKAEILSAHSKLSNNHIQSMLRRWFLETEGAVKVRGRGPAASRLGRGSSVPAPVGSPPQPPALLQPE